MNYLNVSQSDNSIIQKVMTSMGESTMITSEIKRWCLNEQDYNDLKSSEKLNAVLISSMEVSS